MRVRHCLPLALLGLLGVPVAASPAEKILTLATTTSTENTGLLAHIHPGFEARTGIRIKVIAKGTGASLQLGRDGNADVLLVHAPELESQFVAEGFGILRRRVMYNDFVLLGPASDPARVKAAPTAAESLARVARAGRPFVSRGDGSGTHVKEQELWRKTGLPLESQAIRAIEDGKTRSIESIRPTGNWYFSIGQGMGKTLSVAAERQGYALSDRGTYDAFALAKPPRTDLVIVSQGDPLLRNPYSVIAVNPARHPQVNYAAARQYIEWITSPEVQRQIGAFGVRGRQLFHPDAERR